MTSLLNAILLTQKLLDVVDVIDDAGFLMTASINRSITLRLKLINYH
ncbi:hypothetical protein Mtc_1210 [Methanocella conradii HZ254]|uniref:Uncharacterized protein n=1 Tax=Methanocella conradii (strain DSM 24694 / JCM 17849 / CGMCC 1.5162 / HZ254) TaxID=1041930 RepID=H8I8Q9_METCZ|nr:hypothetical protein Mtc_1210 [Methanocella conradii HZ254]